MKKFFYLLSSVLMITVLFSCSSADPVADAPFKWYTVEEAAALNKDKSKVYFVDVYTDWCGWCKRMDKATFAQPEIQDFLKKNFIPVKFNAEQKAAVQFLDKQYKFNPNVGRKGTHDLARMMLAGRMSYPSFAFMNGAGEVIEVSKGYKTPEQFMPVLEKVAGQLAQN